MTLASVFTSKELERCQQIYDLQDVMASAQAIVQVADKLFHETDKGEFLEKKEELLTSSLTAMDEVAY
ncbi:hypothetical protein R1flu_022364 [Riccia fluitans]|uniref:Uncharacterized protein n=1 Tax=Riccia fluitans TaxID=41844 RepID=A0ABD1ZT45_9MARC